MARSATDFLKYFIGVVSVVVKENWIFQYRDSKINYRYTKRILTKRQERTERKILLRTLADNEMAD